MLILTKILNYLDVIKDYDYIVSVLLVLACIYWVESYLYNRRARKLIKKMWKARHRKMKERKCT